MTIYPLTHARIAACAAVALVAVGGLTACSSDHGDTAVGTAQSYLKALADGNADQLAELSGLTVEDPSIAALASATARITGPTIISPEPSATAADGEEAQATLDVTYTLDGMLATTTLSVARGAGEDASWLVTPPTEKVVSASSSRLLAFTIGDTAGAVAEADLLPGVYPIAMTDSPYVTSSTDSVTVQDEPVIVEAIFDSEKFAADANELIGPAIAGCLAGEVPEDYDIVCTGEWGVPRTVDLSDTELGMGPSSREIVEGETTATQLGDFAVSGDPLPTLPTVTMTADDDITSTRTLTVTKRHPITSYTMISDITATTAVTVQVDLDDAGEIGQVLLTGEREYRADVRNG